MFSQLVESRRAGVDVRRTAYFFVWSAGGWLMVFLVAVLLGIWIADVQLAEAAEVTRLLVPPPPAPPPPPAGEPGVARRPSGAPVAANPIAVPTEIRREVQPTAPANLPEIAERGIIDAIPGVGNGGPGGVPGGNGSTPAGAVEGMPEPPPQPKPEVREEPRKPMRLSEGVTRGNAVERVTPAYPPLARAAGISGDVVIELLISEDGSVVSTRVVSGHPFFQAAAVESARRWRFRPTLLNGVPVKVTGVLTFRFTL